ncbi:hypothetical protein OZX61_12545 (plasmid) [Acinetobacter sp. ESL0695]|uniref:hypothetical protein n=1 Tax=Acinetobacter sp. ESL0695 TaxID=2983215 RepID=UPI0023F31AA7|nr:hypothetical protein [Acinetobacter sp. ESL0695]WEV50204.1 hypothetical protein OZX61_12545 [Acinetobacter sp. ESL0695]
MPNLTFYVSKELLEKMKDMTSLTQNCLSLCVKTLGAELEKVHIIYIPAQLGYGHPIYVELIYRFLVSRSSEVMTTFMCELDQIVQNLFEAIPGIRCFACPPQQLYAYN